MIFLKKLFPYFIVIALSFFSFKPLLAPGFFPIHDDTQIARVYEMTKGLKDGMFPVRWSADLGYGFGYPVFNFYDPTPYYVGALINFLGTDSLSATKLMAVFGIVLSGLFMYMFASQFWGVLGGILSAGFYMFASYHAVDIYVRGDFAESFAYAFIPLIFYGLWKIYKEVKWKYVILTSFSFALIITSHNLTAMIISPFLFVFLIYLLFNKITRRTKIYLFFSLILGVLISSFYAFPAVLETNYTNVLSQIGGGADFRDHYVCLPQLWSSLWGYGGSAKGCIDGISFMIGKYHVAISSIIFIFSLIFLFSKKYLKTFEEKEKIYLILLFYVGFLISIVLTLDLSKPVWEAIKPMSFIQYPWRFLIMIVFFSSFICGALPWFFKKITVSDQWKYVLTIFILILIIVSSIKFFNPQTILRKTSIDYTNVYSLKWTASKTSDEFMPKDFQKPQDYSKVANINKLNSKDLTVVNFSQKTEEYRLMLDVKKNTSVVLPIAYFPSWRASINSKQIDLKEDRNGIGINLPEGKYNLKINYVQTYLEKVSEIVSIAAIAILFGYNALKKKYE